MQFDKNLGDQKVVLPKNYNLQFLYDDRRKQASFNHDCMIIYS